jgi:hypothetical protein
LFIDDFVSIKYRGKYEIRFICRQVISPTSHDYVI